MKLEQQMESADLLQGQCLGKINSRLQGNIVGCFIITAKFQLNGKSEAELI